MKEWIGKNIVVTLKDNSKYFGYVTDVKLIENFNLFEVLLRDGMKVVFFFSEMIKIEELKDERRE